MTDWPSTVAQTRFGVIVLADTCFGAGSTCAPDPRAYLTTDGVTWTPMAHRLCPGGGPWPTDRQAS